MSKKPSKVHASSARIAVGSALGSSNFGNGSPLSYLAERPDLSALSDPNIVVNFKNLSKKDSTTKSKALEDLQSYVSSQVNDHGDLEQAFLEAWVKVYPRASIDLSRRVRQLAHVITGKVAACAGKRIARYMPDVVGSWLAGLHDGDKSVMRAVQESLAQVFPTTDKQAGLYKVYQGNILEFCKNAILKERPKTLSDERSTSVENSEAIYARVVSSCISLVHDLLTKVESSHGQEQHDIREELLSDDSLWSLLSSKDIQVRRSLYRLLKFSLHQRQDLISHCIGTIVHNMFSKSTIKHQTGSALDFSETLVALTTSHPEVWKDLDSSKTPCSERLQSLFKQGSHTGPPEFWQNMMEFAHTIPSSLLPRDSSSVENVLNALLTGITRKDESRSNAESAWTTYFDLAAFFTVNLPETDRDSILKERFLPVIHQYVRPTSEHSQYSIQSANVPGILKRILNEPAILTVVQGELRTLAERLIESIKGSAPEQSREFEHFQNTAMAEAQRFFSLQAQVLSHSSNETTKQEGLKIKLDIVQQCFDLLNARKGKPFGAAGCVEAAVEDMDPVILNQSQQLEPLRHFLLHDLPSLSSSPSQVQLFGLLYSCQRTEIFQKAWRATSDEIIDSVDSVEKLSTVVRFITSSKLPPNFEGIVQSSGLQRYLLGSMMKTLDENASWAVLAQLSDVQRTAISPATFTSFLAAISDHVVTEDKASKALAGLQLVISEFRPMLEPMVSTDQMANLMQNLLRAEESPEDDISQAALDVIQKLQLMMTSEKSEVRAHPPLAVLQNGFYEVSDSSLSISSLVQLAGRMLKSDIPNSALTVKEVLPDASRWLALLKKHVQAPPAEELTISEIGGIIYLVEKTDQKDRSLQASPWDVDGLSPALRMAWFVAELEESIVPSLPMEDESSRAAVLRILWLTISLLRTQLDSARSNLLWDETRPAVRAEAESFYVKAEGMLQSLLTSKAGDHAFFAILNDPLLREASGVSSWAFYNALTYSNITKFAVEQRLLKAPSDEILFHTLTEVRRGPNKILSAFQLKAFRNSVSRIPTTTRLVNELVADLTGLDFSNQGSEVLIKLVFLNLLLSDVGINVESIAKQRLVFFVKHCISWVSIFASNTPIQTEIYKSFRIILPKVIDVYGDHWSEIVTHLISIWLQSAEPIGKSQSKHATLPLWHATLELFKVLKILSRLDDVAEDLPEAMTESANELNQGLINLTNNLTTISEDENHPLRLMNELLAQLLSSIVHVPSIVELLPLINAKSRPIQEAMYRLLRRHVREVQQDLSVDAALNKSTTRLPEELISCIVQPPASGLLEDVKLGKRLPSQPFAFLLGWMLVFDHLETSSEKVKTDYVANLKGVDCLPGLLNLIFITLGLVKGKPVDASKFEPTTYSFSIEDSPLKDLQWLLIHLYYLCLKRLASPTKSWWIDKSSRQLKPQVETWTEKYFSPLLIREALETVSSWSTSPDSPFDPSSPGDPPSFKTNPLSSTVTFAKPIDEQNLLITIRLPASFPLASPLVEGNHRVAVTERQWRSWLLQTQGVIQFSDNNLIEGLLVLKRNVDGALKGQTECAICYSVVSGERQVPNKKCATCANAFHGACLYRWFKSSNGNSCPLCRTAFNYT